MDFKPSWGGIVKTGEVKLVWRENWVEMAFNEGGIGVRGGG